MVYVTGNGKTIPIEGNATQVNGSQASTLLVVSSNEFARIKEFRLQRRNYQWVEFRNVSLQPGHATTVEVKDSSEESGREPAAVQKISFGPVIERVVADSKASFANEAEKSNALIMIDFDTGSLFAGSSAKWKAGTNSQKAWMQSKGVDAMGVIPKVNGLMGLDMKVVSVQPAAWDETSAATVMDQLSQAKMQEVVLIKCQGDFPSTWLFQTREGGGGILQITGFPENPRGVKIRYKLVRGTERAN